VSLASRLLSVHINDKELNCIESYFNIFYDDRKTTFFVTCNFNMRDNGSTYSYRKVFRDDATGFIFK